MGFNGTSSSEEDNSSENFNILSDNDVQPEKETQEEAGYKGIRCLMGEAIQDPDEAKRIEDGQVSA